MTEEITPVEIKILGKEYRIACTPAERPDLLESARQLDEKMREVRDTGRVVGQDRIAVMAALNIAHELTLARKDQSVTDPEINDQLIKLQSKIDETLNSKEFKS